MRTLFKLSAAAFLVGAPGIQFIPAPLGPQGASIFEGSSETTLAANIAASLEATDKDARKMARSSRRRTPRSARGGRARAAEKPIALSPELEPIVQRACKDCHSNETTWPWYSHVAPASWVIAADVRKGREKLNFSEWSSQKPSSNEVEEICDAVTNGSMPPRGYRLLHPEATLEQHDVEVLCEWADVARAVKGKVADAGGSVTGRVGR